MDHFDVAGAHGGPYRFARARDGSRASAVGGEFLYVRAEGGIWSIIFAGETGNLSTDTHRRWQEAVSEHGANRLYTRLNVAAAARQSELSDILARYDPPMNRHKY